jgi:homopolymeric O-antigen transport system permease protein
VDAAPHLERSMIEVIAAERRRSADRPEDPAALANGPAASRLRPLPEHPLVKIRPSRKWMPLDVREVWAHRELFAILVIRDVTVRYKQTILGIAWAIVQPLMMMAIYTVIFGRFAGIPSDGLPYPLFAFSGLLPWTFIANAVQASGNSLLTNVHVITKVYFPRILIPAASVGMGLVDFGIASIVLSLLMVYYGAAPTWNLLMFPVLVFVAVVLALGLGLWAAALNVRYRDVRHLLPFLIQVWMFLSPIIYPLSIIPARWRWLAAFNPLCGIIGNIRIALFGPPGGFDWSLFSSSVAISLAVLVSATFVFRRAEASMADVI